MHTTYHQVNQNQKENLVDYCTLEIKRNESIFVWPL